MNAALLVMSSALAVGGDVVPAGGIIPAGGFGADAVVVAPAGPGCGSCGSCGPVVNAGGCCKGSFFDKLKSRFAPKPKCCAPAPTCGCETHRPNLFDKLKSKKHSCGCETVAPCSSPCATPGAPVPLPPAVPPKDMPPAPKTKVAAPAAPAAPIVSQDAPALPLVPIAPIPSSTKTSTASPY